MERKEYVSVKGYFFFYYVVTRVVIHKSCNDISIYLNVKCYILYVHIDKKVSGKSKDEQMAEKKQELEKRLQDVTGQLGNVKKTTKKG